jgi:hypothetical protein
MAWNSYRPQEPPPAARRRLSGWLVGGVALLFAGGAGWLLLRPVQVPESYAAATTQASGGALPRVDASADRAALQPATPGASAPLPAQPHGGGRATATGDDLQKVQLALGGGTPQQALEAARTLGACAGADSLDYLRWLSRNGRSEIDPALIGKLQGEAQQVFEAYQHPGKHG